MYWTVIDINQFLDIIQFEFLHSSKVIFCIDSFSHQLEFCDKADMDEWLILG
jgi:hypothetical protein